MTERKFTDEQIIKGFEMCFAPDGHACPKCPYHNFKLCKIERSRDALYLMKRQRTEIERLKKDNEYILMQHKFQRRPSGDCWNDVIEKAKTEAIKEFAERMKENRNRIFNTIYSDYHFSEIIDTLAKEMTEGKQ